MKQGPTRIRRHEEGFTLIELLVVIIILGILSAVVVFAVRSAGDKGKAAAVTTDEKTIRTAEEALCAQAGQYGTMAQLTGADLTPGPDTGQTYKFLSDTPQYHGVQALQDGGPCNGWSFNIGTTDAGYGDPAPAAKPVGNESPGPCYPGLNPSFPYPRCFASVHKLIKVSDSQVLALGYAFTKVYWDGGSPPGNRIEPKAAFYNISNGTWTAADPPPNTLNADPDYTLVQGSLLASGKVLMFFGNEPSGSRWKLFNPATTAAAVDPLTGQSSASPGAGPQWENVPNQSGSYSSTHLGGMGLDRFRPPAQVVLKDNCGAICGKVFIKSDDPRDDPTVFPGTTPRTWELYDPANKSFTQYAYANDTQRDEMTSPPDPSITPDSYYDSNPGSTVLPPPVRLSDGRILMLGTIGGGGTTSVRNVAKLFDPVAFSNLAAGARYSFADAAPPRYVLPYAAPLPDGGAMFTGLPGVVNADYSSTSADPYGQPVQATAIYRSQPNGPGQWHSAGSSCVSASDPYQSCAIMASLPDGRVLARETSYPADYDGAFASKGTTYLFDPVKERWTRSSDYTPNESVFAAVPLDSPGCAASCKVLVVGDQPYASLPDTYRAYLFSPPPP